MHCPCYRRSANKIAQEAKTRWLDFNSVPFKISDNLVLQLSGKRAKAMKQKPRTTHGHKQRTKIFSVKLNSGSNHGLFGNGWGL
ncbi:hypothetical protein V6N13_018965 [Hibiscus sabdariffa]|uniref:Uncharacterized protein n=1 Tax=Hibiscus sabdariffa TaxID=183260 RepID=A0ABR2EKA8_9ROSI